MKTQKLATFLSFSLSTLLLISGCTKKDSFPASNAFYINDQAGALLSSTEYLIYATSLNLYENTSQTSAAKEAKISGAQIVVATALAPLDSLPSTDIFNTWGIGDNDMGLFLLLYFAPNEEDEYFPTYLGMTMEIGEQMSGHLSMARLTDIRAETWDNSGLYSDDYDTKLVHFYLGIVDEISEKVYLASFSHESKLEWYEENRYASFSDYIPSGNVSEAPLPWWAIVLIVLALLLLTGASPLLSLLLTNSGGSGHKGGGGGSRGYKTTRR